MHKWKHTHIELNDPQEGDEEEVEGNEETECPPHVRDDLSLPGGYQHVWRGQGHSCRVGGVQGGNGREASPQLPVVYPWHSCAETGYNGSCSDRSVADGFQIVR